MYCTKCGIRCDETSKDIIYSGDTGLPESVRVKYECPDWGYENQSIIENGHAKDIKYINLQITDKTTNE